jgi:hypothetical protein
VMSIDIRLSRTSSFTFGKIAAREIAHNIVRILFALPLPLQDANGYGALGTAVILLGLAFRALCLTISSLRTDLESDALQQRCR